MPNVILSDPEYGSWPLTRRQPGGRCTTPGNGNPDLNLPTSPKGSPNVTAGRHLGRVAAECRLVGTIFLAVSVCLTVALIAAWAQSTQGAAVVLLLHPLSARSTASVYPVCAGRWDGLNTRRYLVTGAAGFIGFHAASQLRSRGEVVVGLDNFNDNYPVSLKHARAQLLADKGVPVVDLDLNDQEGLQNLFRLCSFTHVLHLAAQAGTRGRNPFAYVQSNIAASVSLMETMRQQTPMPALVYASASSTNSLSKQLSSAEGDEADQPASLYAATMRSLELLAHTYFNVYKMSVTGLRFSSAYGPWGRPDTSVMAFARKMVDGKSIQVFKGTNKDDQVCDFTFVGDIVDGVLAALDSAPSSTDPQSPATYRLFNLGSAQAYTVSEMLTVLQELMGKKAVVQYEPSGTAGEVLCTTANITAAHEALGYTPHTDLQDGLREFVRWYFAYYGMNGEKRAADEVGYVPG